MIFFRSGEKPLELRGEYGNLVLAKQFSQQRMVSNRVLKSVLNQELTACQEYTPDQINEPTIGPPPLSLFRVLNITPTLDQKAYHAGTISFLSIHTQVYAV